MTEEEMFLKITDAMERMKRLHETQGEFNQMVIKTLGTIDQELTLMKVAIGELKKEVRACRA